MGRSLDLVDTISPNPLWREIESLFTKGGDEILIGIPDGISHIPADRPEDKSSAPWAGLAGGFTAPPITDLADDATKLHFGTDKIPARPFLDDGLIEGEQAIAEKIEVHYKAFMEGKGSKTGLNKIGATAVAAVKKFITSDYYQGTVPNSASTIREKGSDKPLIDTGQLVNSIIYVVNRVYNRSSFDLIQGVEKKPRKTRKDKGIKRPKKGVDNGSL